MKRICTPRNDMLLNFPVLINLMNNWLNDAQFQYSNINIFATDEYKLFNNIFENFINDVQFILSVYIESIPFGFVPVKRNLRISLEALLNLYCIINVQDYRQILEYQAYRRRYQQIDKNLQDKDGKPFNIKTKLQIAQNYGYNGIAEQLFDSGFVKQSNNYLHANIFIPLCSDHLAEAKTLLEYELRILNEAFDCLQVKFRNNNMAILPYNDILVPVSGFTNYMCFTEIFNLCKQSVNEANIVELTPNYFGQLQF